MLEVFGNHIYALECLRGVVAQIQHQEHEVGADEVLRTEKNSSVVFIVEQLQCGNQIVGVVGKPECNKGVVEQGAMFAEAL